jgi:tRNA uridine 5-carbamoylmethylation protein Kti12
MLSPPSPLRKLAIVEANRAGMEKTANEKEKETMTIVEEISLVLDQKLTELRRHIEERLDLNARLEKIDKRLDAIEKELGTQS